MSDRELTKEEQEVIQANLVRRLSRHHVLKGVVTDKHAGDTSSKKSGGKTKLAGWKHFVAGGVAGACEVIGTMPLDVVKTQMQINPRKYRNPIDAMTKIYRSNGVRALYYGMPAFLVQTSGKAAIRFTAFAEAKKGLISVFGVQTIEKDYKVISNLACGLMAGSAEAAMWTTPTERLKVLRQADIGGSGKHQGMIRSAISIVRTGGISSLFVGMVPCVIRQASSVGFRFMFYDSVKKIINQVNGGKEGGTLTYMAAGGTVGGLSVALNNPVDVIKNIAQSGRGKGTINIALMIYRENGISGFFRGLSARVPRVFCGQAITFAAYEQMASLLLKM